MKNKKLLAAFVPLVASVLTSCGVNRYEKTEAGHVNARINLVSGVPMVKDDVWKKIEEKTGVTLSISGSSINSQYYTSLSNEVDAPTKTSPDILFAVPSNVDAAAYYNWVQKGYLWDIDELLLNKPGKYSHIDKIIHSDQYKNIMFGDNMHTLIPYINSRNGWTIYYRGDWLIKAGFYTMEGGEKVARTPETIEEFEEVLKYFAKNDPDGNGLNDTYGMSPAAPFYFWNPLYHAFGVKPDYDIDDAGNVSYMYTTPEFRTFLGWAKGLVEKGYIPESFASNVANETDRQLFYNGTTGVLITNGEEHVTWVLTESEKVQHKNNIVLGKAPVGTATLGKEGVGGFSDWGGYWGGYSIFKRKIGPNEYDIEKAYSCLDLLEYLYSEEGGLLRTYGIEGTHWDYDGDGNIVPNLETRLDYAYDIFNSVDNEFAGTYKMGSLWGPRLDWDGDDFSVVIEDTNVSSKYKAAFNESVQKNTLVTSRLVNFTSYTTGYTKKINNFQKKLNDIACEVVQGRKSLTAYDATLASLQSGDWADIQAVIKEAAKKAGIIE